MMTSQYRNAFWITGSPVDSPHKGLPRSTFGVIADVNRNELLNKQSSCRWFDGPLHLCDVTMMHPIACPLTPMVISWVLVCFLTFAMSFAICTIEDRVILPLCCPSVWDRLVIRLNLHVYILSSNKLKVHQKIKNSSVFFRRKWCGLKCLFGGMRVKLRIQNYKLMF